MDLKDLGFDKWFEPYRSKESAEPFEPARITVVHRDSYILRDAGGEYPAEAAGKFLFSTESELDMPAVGDWVDAAFFNQHSEAVIHRVYPRRTVLKRKSAGEKTQYQIIAANIDTAMIMQSCSADFNLRRLERYLVAIRDGGIRPVLLLSKSDLVGEEERDRLVEEVRAAEPGIPVFVFSNITGSGREEIKYSLEPGKTFCLIGSSGVGKTTLLNFLVGEDIFFTKAIREKDEKGRHATSRRQLVMLQGGAMIIDTPGMRELGVIQTDEGIRASFPDIDALAGECRFSDCTHVAEEGCAVLQAVEEGMLDGGRYRSFLKLRRESAFNEMTYLERRRRDKAFGRMVKDVMTHRKKQRGD